DQLSCVEGDDWAPVPLPLPNSEARIASSASGGVWLFTRDRLWRWQDERFVERAVLPELQGAHFVQAAIEDRHGFLWVGTRSQGVYRVVNSELLPVPVSSNDVTALSEDADGNIWAATDGGGLSRLRPKAHHLFDRTSGLKDDLSYTVTTDTAGAVWLANRDGGMVRIVGETVEIASQRAGWRSFSARSAYAALDGTVWMTTGIGVFRTQAAAPDQLERVASLSHLRGARATYVTRAGDYWLAADPDRVARWTGGRLTTFGPDEGYGARELRALAEDSGGRLWLGAANGALFRFENERFQRVPFLYDHDAGVLQVIRCEDDGTLLIGTTRRGVLVVPRGDFARARYLDRQRGLVDNNISQILVDDADRVWFAARRGIFWIDGAQVRDFVAGRLDDVHAVVLGKDDGLPYLSCQGIYQPAAWKAQDGTLWFATRRGMLRTNPALLDSATAGPPPVAITAIACDGRIQPIATELALNSTVRQLELRLSVLNLTSPESVQIRTRLEGFDPDWVVHGNERVVRYPQLPPGRYAFTAIASNGSGAWSRPAALLTLVVSPPWWHRWWAWTGYVLVAVVVVVASVRRWSHRRLRRRLEQAEREHAIELERSRIARNIHDDVGASLTRISLLTQAAQQESGAA
ncbi:MAG TPA: two-component regulator propeller domain-containing protein, partial [Candidatus Synoicihabitans sp.]|nr:two-component regulator propeller domain-containing protein [Candidatus Synoicihabitans sp.]